MGIPEADRRLFLNIWVCMKCNGKMRSGVGKPARCRKCGSNKLRQKHKKKKKG